MNSITVAGQLGKDAELRHMANGDAIASFSLADSQGKEKPTIWWSASLFGKRAESLCQYLTKGQAVTVSGSVTEREWQDKEGNKRKSMDIRVQDIALQGGRKDAQDAPRPATYTPQAKSQPAPANTGDFSDMDSDIPF